MLFSFRSCESDAFLPVWASLPTKHTLKSFMIISLSDDYIVAESCPGLLYLFFLFVILVYVHCDGDIGVDDVGEKAQYVSWQDQ